MLHVRVTGAGSPVVLIHGLFGSLENLGAIARPLSEHHQAYAIDLPNHGRSPHQSGMDLDAMASVVGAWMDGAELDEAHFVGHSLGGKVAMELALRQPHKVRSLAVIDIAPVPYSARHDEVFRGLLAIHPAQLMKRAEADDILQAFVPELPIRSFLLKNLAKAADGHFHWRMNLADIHQQYAQLVKGNCSGRFAGPVLFLKGGESGYIQQEHREAILERFPRAKLKTVANTGHWLHAEKPRAVAKLLENFIAASDEDS